MVATFFSSGAEWRKWLSANHRKADELLLGFYKTDSGKGGISYGEALDEALCFGWIDGIRRNIDATSYSIRFTPRRSGSTWSEVNVKRMGHLMEAGRVHSSGTAAFEKRDQSKTKLYSYEERHRALTGEYLKTLQADSLAWEYFSAQAPYYRKVASWFVMSAKKEDTRQRRLALLIDCSRAGERLPQTLPSGRK